MAAAPRFRRVRRGPDRRLAARPLRARRHRAPRGSGPMVRRRGAALQPRRAVSEQPIAVFDSGVGGLTVLHECLVSLPAEDFVYLGDDANFPYGTKSGDELRGCVRRNVGYLLGRGAKLLVVACNSATTAGADTARE